MNIKSLLVGICMGIADLIPGVSGGTIAFIAGIYEKLLTSISRIDKTLLGYCTKGQIARAWQYVQGNFLASLIVGVAIAVLIGSSLIELLLKSQPTLLFSFFCGLIIASVIGFIRTYASWRSSGYLGLGVILGVTVTTRVSFSLPTNLLGYFAGGVVGSAAMILPGISGSYILLIIGMYEPVISSISRLTSGDMTVIPSLMALGVGVIFGLLMLGRVLKKIYTSHPTPLILLMTGLMAGALPSILPTWSEVTRSSMMTIMSAFAAIGGAVVYVILYIVGNSTKKIPSGQ